MSTKGPQARLVEMMVEHTEERRRGEYWEVAQVMMVMMVMMLMMVMMVMIERKERWKRNFQWNLKLHDDDYGGKNDSETLLIWQFDCDDDVVDEVEEEKEEEEKVEEKEDHNDLSITSCT